MGLRSSQAGAAATGEETTGRATSQLTAHDRDTTPATDESQQGGFQLFGRRGGLNPTSTTRSRGGRKGKTLFGAGSPFEPSSAELSEVPVALFRFVSAFYFFLF